MQTYESINFGTGDVFLDDKRVGTLKDISVDFAAEAKTFKGDMQWDVEGVITGKKISFKASSGAFDGDLSAAILGAAVTAGETLTYTEAFAAGAGPHVVANGATHVGALEVLDSAGQRMTKVTTPSAVGQYSVNDATGSYGFFTGEGAKTISYAATKTTGKNAKIANAKVGRATTFRLVCSEPFDATKPFSMTLWKVFFTKWAWSAKMEDFSDGYSFEGQALADAVKGPFEFSFEVA